MFFIKLSLLTFLSVAPGLLVYGGNVITCDGDVMRLSCNNGVIHVTSATFGRTDLYVCSYNHPWNEIVNTTCTMDVPRISEMCNGLSQCEYSTVVYVSPDPCIGTYKYYNTTYHCIESLVPESPGFVDFAENVITCDDYVLDLSCETGLIHVTSATFGRTDQSACSFGRPYSQSANTACTTFDVPVISAKCDGLSQCVFSTTLYRNHDLCFGTYKYYNTTYKCIKGRVSAICADGFSTLDCGNDVIEIISANYGRTDSTTCSEDPSGTLDNTFCFASNTRSVVAAKCNRQSSCTVQATDTIFVDPCPDTSKYLSVFYRCIPRPAKTSVTCEGRNAVLKCGTGFLNILSANYGRTDSTTCSAGQPSKEVANTKCFATNALIKVKKICQGKKRCVVPAKNLIFSNPCSHTHKYLSITYSCVIRK